MKSLACVLAVVSFCALPVVAEDAGAPAAAVAAVDASKATEASCKELVKKAVAFFKENGKVKSLAEFSNAKGPFVNGENYLSIYAMDGTVVGHGTNPSLIGKNIIEIKDSHGKEFIKEFIEKAKEAGASGWVEYYWTNPVSKKMEPKAAYFERAEDVIIQAGYYKQ